MDMEGLYSFILSSQEQRHNISAGFQLKEELSVNAAERYTGRLKGGVLSDL